MNYCTLTEYEMQEIEEKQNKKLIEMFENLDWVPSVGDLVREKHGPKTFGLITYIHEEEITVHWQRQTQNNVSGHPYETLHRRYLELIETGKG